MYDYQTPDGYGDYAYIYVYNPAANGLVSGKDYNYLAVEIQDGDFVMRAWAGAVSVLSNTGASVSTWGTIQLYDPNVRLFFDAPTLVFDGFNMGVAVLPEKVYQSNSPIRFDLTNTLLGLDDTNVVPVSQLAFYGVRRVQGAENDPPPSDYPYKEIDFSIPFSFALQGNGTAAGPGKTTQYIVQIQDYDFELRRIEYAKSAASGYFNLNYAGNGVLFTAPATGTITFVSSLVPNFFSVAVVGTAVTVTMNAATVPTALFVSLFNASIAAPVMTATQIGTSTTMPNVPGGPFTVAGGFNTALGDPVHPEWQMTLYDANWRARSNGPVNCNRILHYWLSSVANPMNFFPAPGILYPVNGVIRFDALSLLPVGATNPNPTIYLVFKGVRRLPC